MLKMIRRLKVTSLVDIYLLVMAFTIPWQTYNIVRNAITIFHVINVGFLAILLLLVKRKKLDWPYVIPALLYLMGSITGMFSSEVLGHNIWTLSLDFYLYLWFALMCVIMSSARRVEYLMIAWAIALLPILGSEGLGLLGGDKRLEFTFRNPNRAASYFALSFFFLLHPSVPRVFKVVSGVAIVMAISASGSVAGLLMIPMGLVVFAWAWSYVRAGRGLRPLQHVAWGLAALVCIYAGIFLSEGFSTSEMVTKFSPRGGPRMEEGADDRALIWKSGLKTFREHPFGIGPASFLYMVEVEGLEDPTKGMHSDFVASLVERGVIGLLGFVALLVAVAFTTLKMVRLAAQSGDRKRGSWEAALAGAFAAYCWYAVSHEMLHHETFWLLLALIVAQVTILRRERVAAVTRAVPHSIGPRPLSHPPRRRVRVG